MKTARVEIILFIAVLVILAVANQTPLAYAQKNATDSLMYPPAIYPKSVGVHDGWVLESGEFSSTGGIMDWTSQVVIIGDNAQRKQYRAILHFNTDSYNIPPTAIIYKAVIRVKLAGVEGEVSQLTFGKLLVDLRKPSFGAYALQLSDFQALPTKYVVAGFVPAGGNVYKAIVADRYLPYINTQGPTQFRIRFKTGDDNDSIADNIKFFSGNASILNVRPYMEIRYWVPYP